MNDIQRANRLFVKGYREMDKDKTFYPNANSTLRLTYGSILPYSPKEGVNYDIYTTLEEGLKKEDPNNPEFHVPEKLKELFKNKDFGRYANEKGEMVVNFISNNDITGGNSGSQLLTQMVTLSVLHLMETGKQCQETSSLKKTSNVQFLVIFAMFYSL